MSNFPIKVITIHCSATKASVDWGAADIDQVHRARGWHGIGYHHVVRRDGTIEAGRPEEKVGAHVGGHNTHNLGICMVGGLDDNGNPEDNFTAEQYDALKYLVGYLRYKYPTIADVKGHRDWSPDLDGDGVVEEHEWLKSCPCFEVKEWYQATYEDLPA